MESSRDTPTVGDGGVLIGGDVTNSQIHVHVAQAADRHHEARGKASPDELLDATRTYLNYLHDRYSYLDLKGMGVADRVPLRLRLLDVFVPLKARGELPRGETWDRRVLLAGRDLASEDMERLGVRLSEPRPVRELVAEHDALVVLGDPGSGKTTFVKSLAVTFALGKGEELGLGPRLPILVPLSAYANALRDADVRLDEFVGDYFRHLGFDAPVLDMLRADLAAGRALLLLDGLDEVRETSLRQTVVNRVTDFYVLHRRAGNKFVLTSRIVGYREVQTPAEGLAECTLVDFDDEEIALFVERWTAALERQAQGESRVAQAEAERERRELLDAVEGHGGVRRLAANPLLLTILALMKRQGVSLPERRVELYELYVRTLLSTWNRARGLDRPPERDLDVVETVRVLAPLALWMHEVDPGLGLVKREDLRRRLDEIYQERCEDDPEARTRQLLEDVRDYAGLLLERGPGEYGFIHLTFEEYLAAVAIALDAQGDAARMAERVLARIGEPAWHEVARLLVGYVGLVQQLDSVAGTLVEKLSGETAPAVILAGEAVEDVGRSGVTPRSRRTVVESLVETMQGSEVEPRLRREAGLVLGRLGWRPDDLDAFVEVPAGTFLYGDDREERTIEEPYWIGKYPITNLQFARFVADGGYEREDLWSEDGWRWRVKEKLTGPFPYGRDFENPIFPRVGVSWYEADACCRWLGRTASSFAVDSRGDVANSDEIVVRLPDEVEWERAARGTDGREFPWGNELETARANFLVPGAWGTTAVTTYPTGVAAAGGWDMGGNVLEWTSTWTEPYFLFCGGGFFLGESSVRCAARDGGTPRDFYNFLGFRVALFLANSEF